MCLFTRHTGNVATIITAMVITVVEEEEEERSSSSFSPEKMAEKWSERSSNHGDDDDNDRNGTGHWRGKARCARVPLNHCLIITSSRGRRRARTDGRVPASMPWPLAAAAGETTEVTTFTSLANLCRPHCSVFFERISQVVC